MFINRTYIYQTTTLWLKITLFSVIFAFSAGVTVFAQTPTSSLAGDGGQSLFERAKAYHDGDGVEIDLDKARALYQQAAVQGDIDARVNLGYMYFIGEGVLQNFDVARKYYLQAANVGDSGAQKTLGIIYEHGLGVAVDMKTAQLWYDKSDGRAPAPQKTRPKPVAKKLIVKAPAPKTEKPARIVEADTHVPLKNTSPKKSLPQDKPLNKSGAFQLATTHTGISLKTSPRETDTQETDTQETGTVINAASLMPTLDASLSFAPDQIQAFMPLGDASLSVALPDIAAASLRPSRFISVDLWHVPSWVSSGIGALLLTVAFASTIWFISQMRYLRRAEQQYDFATGFFERHRESLRGSYLRTPDSQRLCLYPQDPWSVSLCALMVRFAARRQDNTDMSCKTSTRIMHALKTSPYEARMETFTFVPLVQERLFADIQHLSNGKLQPPKPFQFKHTSFTPTSKLIKARRIKTPPIERAKAKLKRPILQIVT